VTNFELKENVLKEMLPTDVTDHPVYTRNTGFELQVSVKNEYGGYQKVRLFAFLGLLIPKGFCL
jgi:hypothetical protein